MSATPSAERLVLAVSPYPRGFGFALFEGPDHLVDWGVCEIRSHKNTRCLQRVEQLLTFYPPEAVVLEDEAAPGSRRSRRTQELIQAIRTAAVQRRILTRSYTRAAVRSGFAQSGARTKHAIARTIADAFPELRARLPPPRKPWMSEDPRMALFDAAALAQTFYHFDGKKPRRP